MSNAVLQSVFLTDSVRSFPRKKGTLAFNENGTLGSWLDGKGLHLDGKGMYVGFMVGTLGSWLERWVHGYVDV